MNFRDRIDHSMWKFLQTIFGRISMFAMAMQYRTTAESRLRSWKFKTNAPDGVYEASDGVLRLMMTKESYQRIKEDAVEISKTL